MILIAYFTLMRPNNNRALTWGEVMLDPVKRTGYFRVDWHKNAFVQSQSSRGALSSGNCRLA